MRPLILALLLALALSTAGAQQPPALTVYRAGPDRLGNWSIDYAHSGGAYLVFACGEGRVEAYRSPIRNYPEGLGTRFYPAPPCPAGEALHLGVARWVAGQLAPGEPVWFGPYALPYQAPGPLPAPAALGYELYLTLLGGPIHD